MVKGDDEKTCTPEARRIEQSRAAAIGQDHMMPAPLCRLKVLDINFQSQVGDIGGIEYGGNQTADTPASQQNDVAIELLALLANIRFIARNKRAMPTSANEPANLLVPLNNCWCKPHGYGERHEDRLASGTGDEPGANSTRQEQQPELAALSQTGRGAHRHWRAPADG